MRFFRQVERPPRTPTVLQMEAAECGAAALGIVMGYYGKFVALEELRETCGVSRDGSKASHLLKAARSYGFTARETSLEPEALRRATLPAIVFWNFNHFLVVEGFGEDKVYLNDPASGPRVVDPAEFDRSFTGMVLEFEPGPDFRAGGAPRTAASGLSSRIPWSDPAMLYLVLAGLALVLPGLVLPIFTRVFVDDYLVGHMTTWIKPLLLGMALTAAIRGVLTWLQYHYLTRFRAKVTMTMASRFFWHVLGLPMMFYSQRSAGDLSSRVAINNKVAKLLTGELASAALSLLMVIFYALLMAIYDPLLTLVTVAVALLNVVLLRMVGRRRGIATRKLSNDTGKLMGTAMNGLLMIETLKASGVETDFFAKWSGQQAKVVNGQQEMGLFAVLLVAVPPFLNTLGTGIILALGGLRVMEGHLTMGMLVAFQSLAASFTAPINQVVSMGSRIQEMQGEVNRLDDVLDYRRDARVDAPSAPDEDTGERLEGHIELRNVSFGYSKLDPPLIEHFNLTLRPGARVALVGASGCGKSTVSKLVMGLYDPWEGEILFDGKPRDAIPRRVLNDSMAMVSQDIALFEGSVRDNITLWDDTIPQEQYVQAATDACIHDAIAARQGAYESHVQEGGANFSGGQRQRIEIARALAIEPRILVLDEATSALDPLTERRVDDNMRKRGCTCLIVAHRLSTIRDCDEIIVLDKGKVVQRGTHEQMRDADGPYAALMKST